MSCNAVFEDFVTRRLHMLNEIEETARVFLNFSSETEEGRVNREQLLSQWQTRLNMMQVRP